MEKNDITRGRGPCKLLKHLEVEHTHTACVSPFQSLSGIYYPFLSKLLSKLCLLAEFFSSRRQKQRIILSFSTLHSTRWQKPCPHHYTLYSIKVQANTIIHGLEWEGKEQNRKGRERMGQRDLRDEGRREGKRRQRQRVSYASYPFPTRSLKSSSYSYSLIHPGLDTFPVT